MATTVDGGRRAEGDRVDDSRGAALLRWWAALAQRRAAREPDRAAGAPSSTGASPDPPQPLGPRLVGTFVPLTRLAVVPAGTIAVLVEPDGTTHVRRPDALLAPRLLARSGAPVTHVLPVSTEPVHLDVTLDGLVSLDGYPVDPVALRLQLQLDEGDDFVGLATLVAAHGQETEAVLLDPVQRSCATAVKRAVRVNRLADLQRLGLGQVLADRWLPTSFGGLLLLRGFDVLEAQDAGHDQDDPTVPILGHHPVASPSVPAGTP